MKIATKQNWQFLPTFKPDALDQLEALRKKTKSSVATPGQSDKPLDTFHLKNKAKAPGSADATPQTQGATSKEPALEKTEESTDQLYCRFMENLLDTLTPDEAISLFRKARKEADDREDPTEPHIAVLVQNRSTEILKTMNPGVPPKKIRKAAKSNPEMARILNLADSAKAYLKSARLQAQRSSETGTKKPEESETGSEEATEKKPDHLDPKKQAELMAENHKTLSFIADIHAKMAAERRESISKIAQLNRETNQSINDMWADSWAKRQVSQDKHFQAFLQIISGATK